MTKFKEGDHVIANLGVPVPGVVSYVSVDDSVTDVYVSIPNLGEITLPPECVTLDPLKRMWAVGDVVNNAIELATLLNNTVLVDTMGAVYEWDINNVWLFGSELEHDADYVTYPAAILYVDGFR